jgi:hypothetical protein
MPGDGGNHRRSGQLSIRERRLFLFEAVDEPPSRRSRRTVGPIDSPHFNQAATARRILGRDLNKRAARQIRFDHMQRHCAISEARAQEGKLGTEMRKTPDSGDPEPRFVAVRKIGRIDVCEPDVFGEDGRRNCPALRCQRVLCRHDGGHANCQQRFVSKLRRRYRP